MKSLVRGFTLMELMVVVALVAILLSIGIPSFRSFTAAQRVKTATGDIINAAVLARSEALKRNTTVTITPSASGWMGGWTVATGAIQLAKQPAYTGALTIASDETQIAYLASGRLDSSVLFNAASAPKFEISGADSKRCVSFDLSGLPKARQGACPL